LKILIRIIKYFLISVIILILIPYIICPVYKYPEVSPFTGKLYYNPYSNISADGWLKANFHAHTRQWSGITAGSSSDEKIVAAKYKELEYDIVGISDYQDINTLLREDPLYVPVYEHGYGALKSHQLVIGAAKVNWMDFLLLQSFHNKQHVIAGLNSDSGVISINHPKLRGAFSPENLVYLKGYDLLEVSSHSYFNATDLWDTALSAGNSVFAMGNDDNHDINDPEDFGYVFTLINSGERNTASILRSLKQGKAFVVELEPQKDTSPQKKIEQANSVPLLSSCSIINDTIEITFSRNFDTLKLIGQNGTIMKKAVNADSVIYIMQPYDTYIRTELNQPGLSNVFLNPIFRYEGEIKTVKPEIDIIKTWVYRIVYIFVAGVILFFIIRNRKKTRNL